MTTDCDHNEISIANDFAASANFSGLDSFFKRVGKDLRSSENREVRLSRKKAHQLKELSEKQDKRSRENHKLSAYNGEKILETEGARCVDGAHFVRGAIDYEEYLSGLFVRNHYNKDQGPVVRVVSIPDCHGHDVDVSFYESAGVPISSDEDMNASVDQSPKQIITLEAFHAFSGKPPVVADIPNTPLVLKQNRSESTTPQYLQETPQSRAPE